MSAPVPSNDPENQNGTDDESVGNNSGSSDDEASAFPGAEADDSDFEELNPDDFPTYFAERDGRLFHSHGSSPYPLPVDTPEQERMNVQHQALFDLLGAHYSPSCPVGTVLAPDPERQKYVLDICTGTGKWVMDVGGNFPHVAFRGFDIVPIATRYPDDNVQFSIHDVNTPAPWAAGTFDLVHARSVTMAVTSYPALIAEAARLLRPGGRFISGEWARALYIDPSHAPAADQANPAGAAVPTPAIASFFAALHTALVARGLPPTAPLVAPLLYQDPTLFAPASVTAESHLMPLGSWHPQQNLRRVGRAFRAIFLRYMDSVRPMLLENESGGLTEAALAQVYDAVRLEVRRVPGLVAVFNTVHAERV